ncbi:transposase, partial [Candidatus Riflebacteria bacterium]
RQYCGATGKIDNCVVTVHLGMVRDNFHCLLDGDLYLPEEWIADADRRKKIKIPDEIEMRTKHGNSHSSAEQDNRGKSEVKMAVSRRSLWRFRTVQKTCR